MHLLVSGYSETLLLVEVGREGSMRVIERSTVPRNLSFLAQAGEKDRIYAVQELPEERGAVHVLSLEPVRSVDSRRAGVASCHLAVSPDRSWLAAANYIDGTVDLYALDKDGSITDRHWRAAHRGSGPDKVRQERAHAHGATFSRESDVLYVCDLGIDTVMRYTVPDDGSSDGTLSGSPVIRTRPGDGPRHLVFNRDHSRGYVVNELSNTVDVYAPAGQRGGFSLIQSVSTLPAGFSEESTAAEIGLHPSGRYLYASNRGHDSIAV
ncbi:MAG: lactonase family protein, partial [Spirochaetaceae bacterium]